MPTPEEIAAANAAATQQQKDAAAVAEATHLLKVKLDLEEMSDEAEVEIQTLKLKQIELANQAKMKRRAILKKALDDGLSSDKLPDFDFVDPSLSSNVSLPSVSVPAPAAAPPSPAAAPSPAAPGVSNPFPAGDLSQLLGGQRLKFSSPSEEEKLDKGHAAYVRFQTKFKSEVLNINGLCHETRFWPCLIDIDSFGLYIVVNCSSAVLTFGLL